MTNSERDLDRELEDMWGDAYRNTVSELDRAAALLQSSNVNPAQIPTPISDAIALAQVLTLNRVGTLLSVRLQQIEDSVYQLTRMIEEKTD